MGQCRICKKKDIALDKKQRCANCAAEMMKYSKKNPVYRVARAEIATLLEEKKKCQPHSYGWIL